MSSDGVELKRDTSDQVDYGGLSIVIPVYNEQGNIEPLIDEILNVLSASELEEYTPFELVFADDGSTDGSRRQLRELAERHDTVRALFLSRNFGQTAALAAGIDASTGDIIVTMDADRQNDPNDIPRLLKKYKEGYDCVSGRRVNRQDPITKRLPSTIQTYLAKRTGPDIHDFGCTLKVYNADSLRDIDLYGEGHRYIPAKLYNKGYRITETEVNHRERKYGSSKYGAKRLMKGSLDLLFHAFWNRFSTRPLHLYGSIGTVVFSVGGLLGIHMLFTRLVLGNALEPHLPRLLLVTALVLFGLQIFIFGVLAEILTRIYYQDQEPYRIQTIIE
ncbi:glycosyltransferase family 2 protein [Haloarchaeobius amylolyticus]|uniref:Glycosyltransferase family 2 protein n=1 Tax=Haloarchaeobius amylolyticus TaxID=1198296 RepID=A0ABD6BCI8_9EURY